MTMILACGQEATRHTGANPLLESWDEIPFGIAPFDRIEPEHYLEAFDVAFDEQSANIAHIVADSAELTFESVIWALDNSNERLLDLKDLYEMSVAAVSNDRWSAVSEVLMPRISAAQDSVLMNDALFQKVKSLYERRNELKIDDVQMRLLERKYNAFVRGGATLDEERKGRLVDINMEIALLNSRFARNLIKENDAFILKLKRRDLDGLPNSVRTLAAEEATQRGFDGQWVITLNPSSMIPFLTNSDKRELREEIYKAYISRGSNGGESDNREIVRRVTELRQERAQMLGYENHAEYVISQQMAGSAEAAYELLDKLWNPALDKAMEERELLQRLLEKDVKGGQLEAWDWWYYTEKRRQDKYRLTHEALSPYFAVEGVRGGIFTLANRLYGLVFRPIVAPLIHNDCVAFEVIDRDNSHVGVLYFDLYSRQGKEQGAWCGNLREQRYDGGDKITPVVSISCNFARPTDNSTTMLTLNEVETLFHEFGHALHFLLQDVDYRGLSSAHTEGDFMEFPSQVMENWATHPDMLRKYAIHYRTGQPMPDWMERRIVESRDFNQGYETLSITSAALLDLELQRVTNLEEFNIEEFEQEVLRDRRGLIKEIEPRYHLPYFPHLFIYDYSAGYYFYLWSEVLEKDCFEAFRSSGDIFSRELADKLRHEVLERGSELSGRELYHNFRGTEPSEEYLLKARGLK